MKCFRVARQAPTWQHVATTAVQIVVFWTTFLAVLPWLVRGVEQHFHLPEFGMPAHRAIGAALFALASALGLWSGLVMSVRGRGTPLPLCTAREFVQSGPYHLLRNPMALAGITQGIAVGLWLDSAGVVSYALIGGLAWHAVARGPEEHDLLARFGDTYARYRERVPLWLPRFGRRRDLSLAVVCAVAAIATAATVRSWPDAWRAAPACLLFVLLAGLLARRAHAERCAAANADSSGHSSAKSTPSPP